MSQPRKVGELGLLRMRAAGGTWAAYENQDLGHIDIGHMKFLKVGEDCTCKEPPKPFLPDTKTEVNWRYVFIGMVNLETGEIDATARGASDIEVK
jgi:hypothetical protein